MLVRVIFPISVAAVFGIGITFIYFTTCWFFCSLLFLVVSRDRLVWLVNQERNIRDRGVIEAKNNYQCHMGYHYYQFNTESGVFLSCPL